MSNLEDTLAFQLKAADIPFEQQVKVIPGRRFAFDFLLTGTNILVEVQGSTWVANTGHTSGKGIKRDCEKANLAVLAGYRVLTFTGDMVNNGEALQTITRLTHTESGEDHHAIRAERGE